MKRIVALAVLILVAAPVPPANAQGQAQSARPGAAGMMPAQEPKKPAPAARQRSRSTVDARGCLELATIPQIIKCAEKYR